MKMQRSVCLTVAVALSSASGATTAQSFRCANGIVDEGDSKATVSSKCGEPVLQDSFCAAEDLPARRGDEKPAVTANVSPCVNIDHWTFNPGKGKFLTTLRFEDGNLVSIEQGDRVRD